MKKLSIIIPMYNVQDYIADCLDSVFSQWDDSIEIICIDDGSTDLSYKEALQYKNKLSSKLFESFHLYQQENVGLSATRNRGIDLSDGEFIAFLDSDDKLKPNFMKCVLEVIFGSNRLDIIEFNIEYSTGGLIQICTGSNSLLDKFKTGNWYACGRVFNRNILSDKFKVGINYEDMWLVPQLYLQAENIVEIDKPLYWYRYNESGITQSVAESNVVKSISSFEVILNKYKSYEMDEVLRSILLIHVLYISTIYVLKNRSFEDAVFFTKNQNINIDFRHCLNFKFRMNVFIYLRYVYLYFFNKYRT